MKTKILITLVLISLVLVFGCTTPNPENEKDILNEINDSLIEDNEIETGEIISTEENIQEITNNETIDENEEVDIGEII